jgi:hypothetical protein
MPTVEQSLAKWATLHDQFQVVRARYKSASERPGPIPEELRHELEFIQRKCEKALDDLLEAYRTAKSGG